jgi:hypothetical protein
MILPVQHEKRGGHYAELEDDDDVETRSVTSRRSMTQTARSRGGGLEGKSMVSVRSGMQEFPPLQ